MIRYTTTFFLLFIAGVSTLQIGAELALSEQMSLLYGQLNGSRFAESFAEFMFSYSQLPRLVIALMIGSMLGLVGSLMQQLTQNPMMSPLTLGTSSGAWLALVIVNVWFPELIADYSALAAMCGAMLTMGLVILIAGIKNLSGLPIVLSGMAVNILLGAVATAIILLNDQYAKNLFIWGAGDLTQNGWDQVLWLLPRLSVSLVILFAAPRILAVMRLGQQGAAARGLNVIPAFLVLIACGLWLVASSITTVGVISFIGLLAPNLARSFGARTPKDELLYSMLLGALMLLLTDGLAIGLSQLSNDMIPSGTAAAAIGAPALIWFTRRKMKAQDQLSIKLPPSRDALPTWAYSALSLIIIGLSTITLLLSITELGWQVALPTSFSWEIRWPRLMTALAAGAGLAVAGTILQRLIYNPLASPDILGISAGATFTLVASSVFFGTTIFESGPIVAFAGSMVVLSLILFFGRRHQFAPSMLILTGIALTALIEALVQFALSRGTDDVYTILGWLAGSTYRVTPTGALTLFLGVAVLIGFAIATSRWLTLISAGRQFAAARGLNVSWAFTLLLCCVALLCALVTTTMGPVAFIGLLAPHMAVMMGAKAVKEQIIVAALVGASLMVFADWLGQVIVYPSQIAAGTLVSVIGGTYFILLLIRGRMQ
ncbi:Fe(3+)-hydroxamate ABC transporter permease FhuB [Photobacterium minamisatsumaniensis]|uniref:Fe(3+)-hydroxamate ABC transporter permease FhuB n=1 Tax=Photobacterium minamisatsumaniensis TaxID=2910233 RepID=UPI003D0EB40A